MTSKGVGDISQFVDVPFNLRDFPTWWFPAPSVVGKGVNVQRVDTTTNARIKQYLFKDVLQVSNIDMFPTGDFERSDGHKKRDYNVPPPGHAADPVRSLEESQRRAKSKIRDIALCNQFTHMFTWTLDPAMVDRYSPDVVYKKVRAFLSNATQRQNFRYVCIPEYHELKDDEEASGIHFHGLCMLGDVCIEKSIRSNGSDRIDKAGRTVYNMTDWRLGWSTCVALDEHYERAVEYIAKYITKSDQKIFGKWYLSSRTLVKKPDIIPLERVNYYEFRDEQKIESGEQYESTIFKDVKVVTEEYERVCSD